MVIVGPIDSEFSSHLPFSARKVFCLAYHFCSTRPILLPTVSMESSYFQKTFGALLRLAISHIANVSSHYRFSCVLHLSGAPKPVVWSSDTAKSITNSDKARSSRVVGGLSSGSLARSLPWEDIRNLSNKNLVKTTIFFFSRQFGSWQFNSPTQPPPPAVAFHFLHMTDRSGSLLCPLLLLSPYGKPRSEVNGTGLWVCQNGCFRAKELNEIRFLLHRNVHTYRKKVIVSFSPVWLSRKCISGVKRTMVCVFVKKDEREVE